ncbi:MAG: RrF2 family transcriptional regulator [bacterium]
MLSLSQTTAYAIMALATIANREGEFILAREIAERTGIPKPYLSKLIYQMGDSGLIHTKRGYKGGLSLKRPAREITLLDIIKAVEGEVLEGRCILGLPECMDENPCPMHSFWLVESEKIREKLLSITLDQLAKAKSGGWRLRNGMISTTF